MGEFDVALLLDEYASADTAKEIYPSWRGGYYYAAHPKGDPATPLALVYVSEWDSADTAGRFADIYREALKKRYHSLRLVQGSQQPAAGTNEHSSKREWLTESGDVVIEATGPMVFITEAVDDVTSAKLRDAVLNRAKVSTLGNANVRQPLPMTSSLFSTLNAFWFRMPLPTSAGNDRPLP
jgi:hypothetical protein